MTPVLAGAAGMLVTGGMLAVILGLVRTDGATPPRRRARSLRQLWVKLTRRPIGTAGRRRDVLLLGSLLAGLVVAALTGWLIALVLVPAVVLGLPAILSTPKARDVVLLEALDRWVRTLSTTLPTGKSIPDAIRLSRRTAPKPIKDDLDLLVARLNSRWDTREALLRFADAMDSPDADGVVAALMLAANRGSTGAAATLEALADSLQAQLRGRRMIETERAKPYIVVRQVTVITLVTLALAFAVGRDFFAPYATPTGQLILSALVAGYIASLVVMRRRARPRRRHRILVGPSR